VRLKEAASGGGAAVSYGWRETEYTVPVNAPTAAGVPNPGPTVTRERSDGHVLTLSGWKGLALGDAGFLTVSAEYKDQQHTERSGFDTRPNYPGSRPSRTPAMILATASSCMAGAATRTATPFRPASTAAPSTIATSSRSTRTASCR
jgi:hypothetical protein